MSGEEWFAGEDASKGIGKLTRYSTVTPFVDAEEYYADLRREVEATKQGHQICWIGFDGGDAVPMPIKPASHAKKPYPPRAAEKEDVTWFDLLKAASSRRVAIRVLLNLHPSPSPTNRHRGANYDLVRKLNQLANCGAIDDFRFLWLNGTHHQKLVLVVNDDGLIAYGGTMDVHPARIVDRWCEIQCKFTGEAAKELYNVFAVRWREHMEALSRLGSLNAYLKPLDSLKTKSAGGNLLVQIATTYGNPTRRLALPMLGSSKPQAVNDPHRFDLMTHGQPDLSDLLFREGKPPAIGRYIGNDFFAEQEPDAKKLIDEARKQRPEYAFASKGHTGIYHMLKHALERTKQFVYMEDQYLVCDQPMGSLEPMAALLAKKVKEPEFRKLIILMTRIDEINEEFQFTAWAHRENLLQQLLNAGGDKVVICQYKARSDLGLPNPPELAAKAPFYIHSKTWFFDDALLVCGSANCNRRGYSHDSELDFAVYDQDKRFVKELRIKTWLSRLNTQNVAKPVTAGDVADFASGARFWENPDQYGLAIENNRPNLGRLGPKRHHDLDVQALIDLLNAKQNPFSVIFSDWLRKLKKQGLWDVAVDPDGT